jgi:tetratricopeptide (TPR) repeat protein
VAYAHCIDDEERLLDSMLMVGYSLRMLAEFDEARDAYGRLRDMAALLESEQYLLMSELGFAKIAIERGNLPAAAGMLDQIITEAREQEHSDIRSKALMDRARVASQLGDLATAVILGYEALELSTDPVTRERILVNLGMSFTQMGMLNEARDSYLIVNATAQEATMRWLAEMNLMELAYLETNEVSFEQHRRRLIGVELPPYLQAVYQETLAHGSRTFGRESAARAAFQEMRSVAERFGLNEFTIRADEALKDVMNATPPLVHGTRPKEQSSDISTVANAITDMRLRVALRE